MATAKFDAIIDIRSTLSPLLPAEKMHLPLKIFFQINSTEFIVVSPVLNLHS